MAKSIHNMQTARWFFLITGALVLFLFWKVIQPFAIVLVTAGIFAILFAPLDRMLRTLVRNKHLSALFIILLIFLAILIPLFIIGVLIVQEAQEVVNFAADRAQWLESLDIASLALFQQLPEIVQERVLAIDFVAASENIAGWAVDNVGAVFSRSFELIGNTFIFFIALYYFLVGREHIYKLTLELSPLKDKLDAEVIGRIVRTVRAVVMGALIIGVVQAVFAAIGMTIFGVPKALLWGALVAVAAQVPMIGASLIMIPAVIYLFAVGDIAGGVGLTVWAVVVVGMVDNVLSPKLMGSRTNMPEILVLIAILGGLQLFGPIGFILGPTVLAAALVAVDLYRKGILENPKKIA